MPHIRSATKPELRARIEQLEEVLADVLQRIENAPAKYEYVETAKRIRAAARWR